MDLCWSILIWLSPMVSGCSFFHGGSSPCTDFVPLFGLIRLESGAKEYKDTIQVLPGRAP